MKHALALLLLATTIAHADDKVAHAKQLYADGKRYYDVADYPRAIAAWKEAYVLASAPMLLFNIGQAYRLGGDCANALRFYASYERETPKVSNQDELDEARGRCDPHPTNANPPEAVATSVPPEPRPPEPKPPEPKPEPPAVVATPVAPAPVRTLVDDGGAERMIGLGVGGAGVALAATSILLATRASSVAHDLERYRGEWGQAQEDQQAHGHTLATWSWVTGIAGVAGLATGATLWVLGHRSHEVVVEVSSTSAGVSWSGTF